MKFLFAAVFLTTSLLYGQYEGRKFSLSVNTSYTTTSKIYYFPDAEDMRLRNSYEPLDHINSYSVSLRYRLSDPLIAGLNVEKMEKGGIRNYIAALSSENGAVMSIPVSDGFNLYAIELSLIYHLPFSSDRFKFYMGGGGAYYIGKQTREAGSLEISSEMEDPAFGIHVFTGMEYLLNEFVSIRGEMRFRDPEFRLNNKYVGEDFIYQGTKYFYPYENFNTKVNVDGATFTLGLSLQFNAGF